MTLPLQCLPLWVAGSAARRLLGGCLRQHVRSAQDTHGLHGQLRRLPKGDLLVHCGDFSNTGTDAEFSRFNFWLMSSAVPVFGERIFCLAGNHEGARRRGGLERAVFLPHAQLLEQQLAKRRLLPPGLRLFGLSWHSACRALPEPRLDVFLSHAPPAGILDVNKDGKACGAGGIRGLVEGAAPRLHLFGHIHEAYGAELHEFSPGRWTLLMNISNAAPPPGLKSVPPCIQYPITVIDIELQNDLEAAS
uniref:Calcineurin-like phosphoesterase domain-containing protein n=2 Tax=Alexandrium monilatum TaxID=311494 RepID=A0A7S4VD15_9DINO